MTTDGRPGSTEDGLIEDIPFFALCLSAHSLREHKDLRGFRTNKLGYGGRLESAGSLV
jgi:hypothetical protein